MADPRIVAKASTLSPGENPLPLGPEEILTIWSLTAPDGGSYGRVCAWMVLEIEAVRKERTKLRGRVRKLSAELRASRAAKGEPSDGWLRTFSPPPEQPASGEEGGDD